MQREALRAAKGAREVWLSETYAPGNYCYGARFLLFPFLFFLFVLFVFSVFFLFFFLQRKHCRVLDIVNLHSQRAGGPPQRENLVTTLFLHFLMATGL